MDETLMTYLRNIISLEQARYVQGQLLQRLHAAAVPPRKAPICMPQKPKQKWDVADGSIADGAKLGAMLGCVIGFVVLYAALEWIDSFLAAIIGGAVVGAFLGAAVAGMVGMARNRADYTKAKAEYPKKLAQYTAAVEQDRPRYQRELKRYEYCKELEKQTSDKKRETERVLQQLYDRGLLYSKYRNVVAVCSIYEYLESGRCTELTGPDGAYNKFDTELQVRRIEGKLDIVIQKLDEIRTTQEVLCSMVEAGNRLTGELIGKTSESIRLQEYSAEQSAIAAYNTEQAANEAGVCKWMMFLK